MRAGYRAERQAIWEPFAQDLLRGIDQAYYSHLVWDFFSHFVNNTAMIIRTIRFSEDIFLGKRNPVEIVLIDDCFQNSGILATGLFSFLDSADNILQIMIFDVYHRMTRLIALTMRLQGELPQNEEELCRRLGPDADNLKGNQLRLPINYRLINDDRIIFFIASDLSSLNMFKCCKSWKDLEAARQTISTRFRSM